MITEHDLQEAIAECEGQRNPSASTCMKLAAFYTIKDKMYPAKEEKIPVDMKPVYSYKRSEESEYSRQQAGVRGLIENVGHDDLVAMMDDVMGTLQIIAPRVYDSIMHKLERF